MKLTNEKQDELDSTEYAVMLALVRDIRDCEDAIDQFKLIERYEAFVKARATRLRSEDVPAGR